MNYKDFNAIVYTGNETIGKKGFITFRKQTSVQRIKAHFDNTYPLWRWFTIYDRKTNDKEIFKRN